MPRAVIAAEAGDASVLRVREAEVREPGVGEVLVRTAYAGVNFADVFMRRGLGAGPFPFTPGVEGSGVVEAVGPGVDTAAPGDRVAWAPVRAASSVGSYADLAVIGAEQAVPVPDDVSLRTAAAVLLQGLTAHYLVHDQHPVGPGVTVLVHAAAGGTGRTAVRWLHHLGATVFATVGGAAKAAVAAEAGADHVIDYTRTDFADEVLRLTGGRGVDYVVDGVGAGTFRGDLRAVADRGRVCVFGQAAGLPEAFSPMELIPRSITVSGGYMTNFLRDRAEVLGTADRVWSGVREGWLAPLVHAALPLEEAAEAHRLLENRETVGKLVLATGGDAS
ncbi:quinone oxidoreductase family protein [Yinghuangia seranimata]|uniref:quinone oxidoreductase family protein n=1 Tax=Yinghuangia seranimata TaxID=408067 RepID=UPI00248B54AF|nr:quinone oxidoreductase [Yinghuangia seranimata]MDI2130105.1 quinone oxidoreductase [Yinghuangia seranimata]